MWYKNLDRSFFRFVTIHACDGQTDRQTDGQTDGQTEFSSQYRVCITCSAVKIKQASLRATSSNACLRHYNIRPLTCDLENLFSNAHSLEYLCQLLLNPSTNYADIASREIGLNGRPDGRHNRKHNASAADSLMAEVHKYIAGGDSSGRREVVRQRQKTLCG